jgi:hypothetical protein
MALLLPCSGPAKAQVVLPPLPPLASPWNAQRVFESVPFAQRWESRGLSDILPEDTPVKTRLHPGYEQVGGRIGSWMLLPSMSVGGLYNSNVFASSTNAQSDVALLLHPRFMARSLWDRHFLELEADMHSASYLRNPNLDWVDGSAKARGRIDLSHDQAILANFRAARLHDDVGSLASPASAVEPTPYNYITGDVTYWKEFNRLSMSVGTRVESYDYGKTRAQDGTIINQDARDGQIYAVHGRAEYVLSPMFGVFASAEGNRRELKGTPQQSLASRGYRTLGGVSVEFSRLLVGEIAVGYAEQRFDAATLSRIAGPDYRMLLTWSPTRTIDVKFKAESIVTQAVDTDATGVRADSVQLAVDYEFRRNVILSLGAFYENDRFIGQTRQDDVYGTLAEAKYLLNRHWSISARHQYFNRDSNIPTSTYDKHEIGLNVAAQF